MNPDGSIEGPAGSPADLERALADHRAGRLERARRAYQALLEAKPEAIELARLLTLLEIQAGRPDDAITVARGALSRRLEHPALLAALAEALAAAGHYPQALDALDGAIGLAPDDPAWPIQRAAVTCQAGAVDQAVTALQAAARRWPGQAAAWSLLGQCHLRRGETEDAAEAFRRAVALEPGHPSARHGLGLALLRGRRFEEALAELEAAGSTAWVTPALEADLASARLAAGQFQPALAAARSARQRAPGLVAAWVNESAALMRLRQPASALVAAQEALARAPGHPQARGLQAQALHASGRATEARAAIGALCQDHPTFLPAQELRLQIALEERRWSDAVDAADALLACAPSWPAAAGRRLQALGRLCRWQDWEAERNRHLAAVTADPGAGQAFGILALTDDPVLQRAVAAARVRAEQRTLPSRPLPTARTRAGAGLTRPRIGWLSADYRDHPSARLMAGVFAGLDADVAEHHALSITPPLDDPMQQRLRRSFSHWHDLHHLSDDDASVLIESLHLDLVVDLAGLTLGSRPSLLLRPTMPLRVGYLGFLCSSGNHLLDAIVLDDAVLHDGDADAISERVLRMVPCFYPQDPDQPIDDAPQTREQHGLPTHGTILCNFCDASKFNPPMFALWLTLLRDRPDAVLWLLSGGPECENHLRATARAHGVDASRLVFAPPLPTPQHLARLRLADIFLDTWPFNGHTTVSDALWAGLPVVTRTGRAVASRVAGSLLRSRGLGNLVAEGPEDYLFIAARLADDAKAREQARALLARWREQWISRGAAEFTRQLETLLAAAARGASAVWTR